MKHRIYFFSAVLGLVLFLAGCSASQKTLRLPGKEDIRSVTVSCGENKAVYSDPAWISDLIDGLAAGKDTGRESVSDSPYADPVIRIDFTLAEGENTLFLYEKNGDFFAERPYEGIFRISKSVYQKVS